MSKTGATDTKLGRLAVRVLGEGATASVERVWSDHGSFYVAKAKSGERVSAAWEVRCSDDDEATARSLLSAALTEALHE